MIEDIDDTEDSTDEVSCIVTVQVLIGAYILGKRRAVDDTIEGVEGDFTRFIRAGIVRII